MLCVGLLPCVAWANHHGGGGDPFGGGSSSTTKNSGPDYDFECIRWEFPDDGGQPDGSVEVPADDVPTDGGTDGKICVERANYGGNTYGCGCGVLPVGGFGLFLLMRMLRRRK